MLSELIRTADWRQEKHVPSIDAPEHIGPGDFVEVTARIGAGVAHPNITAHHIRWIELYYLPNGANAAYELAHADFSAHGESPAGPDTGPAYTHPTVTTKVKLAESGTLIALAYCNIHGLWQGERPIQVG